MQVDFYFFLGDMKYWCFKTDACLLGVAFKTDLTVVLNYLT